MRQEKVDPVNSDKIVWLANEIFTAFPKEVTGIRLYIEDCGYIYYQRVFRDDALDPQIGIYRDAEDGPCEVCMAQAGWKDRVTSGRVVYSGKSKIQFGP